VQNTATRDGSIAQGMRLIIIDPRRTQTAKRAAIHLQPRPGEDARFWRDDPPNLEGKSPRPRFVSEDVSGIDALRRAVAPFTPAYVARRADIPRSN